MKKCLCGRWAIYNLKGLKPKFCKDCKSDEMITVNGNRCKCGNQSSFNLEGLKARFCKDCKTDEMIYVNGNRCKCGNIPTYNLKGLKAEFCKDCKTDEMINVHGRRCVCGNIPIYNLNGLKAEFCSSCKTDEMINVNVKHCRCGNIPIYNLKGLKAAFCKDCKTDEMITVHGIRCECGNHPTYNLEGLKPRFCKDCKTEEMTNVHNKRCPGSKGYKCPIDALVGNGHTYCMSCDPNEARRKQFKRYEEAFFDFVKGKIDIHQREFRVTFDPEDTSKKFARIDGVVFGDGIIVCIEIDEDGHESYDCDEHRMHLVSAELLQKYPGNEIAWVRVNPTVPVKNQWSKSSIKIRHLRFQEVVSAVEKLLDFPTTSVLYIG
ncbi:hypothetical protein PBCVOR070422_522L [Paramecium bursaria Chlorella virus OR0704.2.2]|nr:hypothetical protein PBCVOR070422_522L [Paramecium bursaria Chlorella virus OR0704.2.2]